MGAALFGPGAVSAQTVYLGDGAVPNANGGWDLPAQGTCPADLTKTTRPDCLGLRLNIVQASCTAPNYAWTTSGVCNDLVNASQAACDAQPDRFWNADTNVCAILMKGDDRNNYGFWIRTKLYWRTWPF